MGGNPWSLRNGSRRRSLSHSEIGSLEDLGRKDYACHYELGYISVALNP